MLFENCLLIDAQVVKVNSVVTFRVFTRDHE